MDGLPIKMDDLGVPLFLETPIFEIQANRVFRKLVFIWFGWQFNRSELLKNETTQVVKSVQSIRWLIFRHLDTYC